MGNEKCTRQSVALTANLAGKPLDESLSRDLNIRYRPAITTVRDLTAACLEGIAEGWRRTRAAGVIKDGRIIEPVSVAPGLAVDVFEAGWAVQAGGGARKPTVVAGFAMVTYVLPGGGIDFDAAA